MTFDAFLQQLPDADPDETGEWLESLDNLVATEGASRARYVIGKMLAQAKHLQVGIPPMVQTDYINTIPPEEEPWFPGDEEMERRIRRIVRWNAAVMVARANKKYDGIGGHLSTYASSASLYEVGFNHFFRGKDDGTPGDQVFYQGHAAPGIYSRAFLEGRLSEDQLDHFRRETAGRGLSSYPAPAAAPRVLGVPHGLDGHRAAQRHLPGALQPLPLQPPAGRHLRVAGVGLPRRRRVRRAGGHRRPLARLARGARQPDLRRLLQPAAAGRSGPGQRQGHPGAGVDLPRRRLERRSRSSGGGSGTRCSPRTSTASWSTR